MGETIEQLRFAGRCNKDDESTMAMNATTAAVQLGYSAWVVANVRFDEGPTGADAGPKIFSKVTMEAVYCGSKTVQML